MYAARRSVIQRDYLMRLDGLGQLTKGQDSETRCNTNHENRDMRVVGGNRREDRRAR
jgi:hypothetical protein